MDILDIIATVIEFSQKEEEFSDEIKTIRATLESLQLSVQQVHQNHLPEHIISLLNQNLQEAQELLTKVSQKKSTWWTTLKNMLPGSDLKKIKEKNQQFLHIINLLNLHLNMIKKEKRSAPSSLMSEFRDIPEAYPTKKVKKQMITEGATFANMLSEESSVQFKKSVSSVQMGHSVSLAVPDNMMMRSHSNMSGSKNTQQNSGELAFRLKLLCDMKLEEVISKHPKFQPTIEVYWEDDGQTIYNFFRPNFGYLPSEQVHRMSRNHAELVASRTVSQSVGNMLSGGTEEEGKKMQEEQKSFSNQNNAKNFPMRLATVVDSCGGDTVESEDCISAKEDKRHQYTYILRDLSLNGTFYLKGRQLEDDFSHGVNIVDEFIQLKKSEVKLEHGDIIGLIMQKKDSRQLIFGFQFLTR